MKVRQNLYIDRAVSDALETLARSRGAKKSRLVNDAVAAWLARLGTKEIDDLLKLRLDRLSRDVELVRRDLDIVIESLSLFVRFQLLVTAPLPEADSAGRAVGLARFEKFVSQVGRQLATGKRTLGASEPAGTAS
ncbi:CopG family transcriptional regulator [Sphingomonas sp.]|jgi:hypothetical protein|uniref:CopG family transcriptional regulator n=1 Tax=Sphingomonas sp. TaxID=28214 RepID=UPI002E300E04|nr:CopG family transcriptional regulator [Sphingomonas sp.]HEX4693636.1 CopG family transcriptional regulator [Sphingomonas sp.]